MPRYTNASAERRVYPTITNPKTGTTLELGPGESITIEDHPRAVEPKKAPVRTEAVRDKGANPEPDAAPAAESPKE